MKGDPEFARAVLALSAHEAPWDTFVSGLRAYEAACVKSLVTAPADEMQVAQGRARALADILSAIDKARSTLDRIPQ